ncbi:NADH:flavin oxidoreductase/NADH oxidase [Sphingobacterium hotanense]|uniref:NADH:flavin oxidoreductase/NADH oxidase n=1 Tax=Sphingobacterium hotanense TaxID=649196 RepID=UPI0021A2DEE8|nr:NADH:flavin oxidoreductase/NADH oxidase [Sphingobacterium hotanense]MCT1525264.1 NADH:flavin oxidoreductase/NADH oxidase [Sphingobacterium hotanense]
MLFKTLPLKNITISNRIVVSPMCQYSAEDGYANNWHLVHLGQFAIGRAGAVIQEATAVSPEGRISYGDLGIWKDEHIEKYSEITEFIKEQGSIPGIQLAHAGRKASTDKPWISRNQFAPDEEHGWQTVSSSDVPYLENEYPPKALSVAEIQQVVKDFADAAERAVKAGYQIIEIHAAHGYLIHQFLSPLVNKRHDEYGGSFENRIRLLMEIVEAIKDILGDEHSLWVRISATDWAEGGWDLEQSTALAKLLKEAGVEVIDVSTGGAVHWQKIPVEAGYQVPFASHIKKETGLITGSVGLINSAQQANQIIEDEHADFVLIARAFLRDPHLVYQWAKDLSIELAWAPQYERAKIE